MAVHRIILRGESLRVVQEHLKLRKAAEAEIERLQEYVSRSAAETVKACVRNNGQSLNSSWGIDTQYLEEHGLAFLNGRTDEYTGVQDVEAHDPDGGLPAGDRRLN